MNTLSFRLKMILSIFTFTLPIAILSTLMYQAHAVNIDFGSKESIGIAYQRPLQSLLESISWHRIYSYRQAHGEPDSGSKLKELESKIASDFELLEKVDSEIGATLEFTSDGLSKRHREGNSLADIKKIWTAIKNEKNSDESHLKLISSLRVMINHLGDTSNLVLDPDLDSYYLMDMTLIALPQVQDRLQEIIVRVETILKQGSISPLDRSKIAVYAAFLKEADLNRISTDINTTLAEDEHFYGSSKSLSENLPKIMEPFFANTDRLFNLLNRLSDPSASPVSLSEFRKVADVTLFSSFTPWLSASEELEKLIKNRVSTLSQTRFMQLAISLLIWLISCVFSLRISQTLTQSISTMVTKLSSNGANVGNSSSKLNLTSQSLSNSTANSAASLEESVGKIEDLTSTVKRTAETSAEVSKLSSEAETKSVHGEEIIKSLIEKMNIVSDESKKVEEVIDVIEDVAFQTNLLALNAAVEAARAGEQGKGFAVVAESVRALASKCTESAKEISILINSNVQNIRGSAKLAEDCGQSLNLVSANIRKLASLNKEVASACHDQSIGLGQISQVLNSLDVVSQNNATSSEEIATTSESLFIESQKMQNVMDSLHTVVYGNNRKGA